VYDYLVNGYFLFSGSAGGIGSQNDLADFLFGLPDYYTQFGEAPSNIRSKNYNGFAQDEWHLRKNFTLTLGVRYEVRPNDPSAKLASLSGGNAQKVLIARWMNRRPKLLLLDEPTQGVDVGAKSEIHALIAGLAARGLAIILISSELPEILGMCDRIAVMHAGTVAATVNRAQATQDRILHLALGHLAEARDR